MSDPALDLLDARGLTLGPAATAADEAGTHWRLARDRDGVAWLVLDKEGSGTNTLSGEVLEELDRMLESIGSDPPRALVLRSAKRAGFIAGADVGEFRGATDVAGIERRIARAHEIVDRLEGLPFPSVAVIHGYCLGGGLEVALACRHRIAIAGSSLGFPEVMLGLHPGLGGTFRSTRLVDPLAAMTMMLTGKPVSARKARRLGLVDAVVEERHVRGAVRSAIERPARPPRRGLRAALLETVPARRLTARTMRARTAAKARESHYPAPYRLIDLWAEHGGDERAAFQRAEIASFSRLLAGETAQNLARVFFLRERLKGHAGDAEPPRHVHVIGAGTMGGDIAAWCALRGLRASLADADADVVARALGRARALFEHKLDSGAEVRDAMDRLVPDFENAGAARADLVIEAVPERRDVKQAVYAQVEPRMRAGAVLATNTSSIPLEDLRAKLARPERLVGLHFFNPVAKMQLVEVVHHDAVDPSVLASARAFVGRIARLTAPVASAPGFLVNRTLTPYLLEALVLLDEGVAAESVDEAALRFGMPMGPIELSDRVGLDVCLHVADVLRESLDRPLPDPPAWLRRKVEQGHLGQKSGRGLYAWEKGKAKKKEGAADPPAETTDRLILPLLDACVTCLREGVCDDAETIDAAMIFATGFAPFRGGPLHYARTRGTEEIARTLDSLAAIHGDRLAPDPGWSDLDRRS